MPTERWHLHLGLWDRWDVWWCGCVKGGGARHTHPVLAGQVWVVLHGGRMGGGNEGMVVGWWAYPCAVAGLLVDAIDSTTLSTQLMGWGSSSRRGVRQRVIWAK